MAGGEIPVVWLDSINEITPVRRFKIRPVAAGPIPAGPGGDARQGARRWGTPAAREGSGLEFRLRSARPPLTCPGDG